MTATAERPARKAGRPIERPLRTEKEYEDARSEMMYLADREPRDGTRNYDRLELLTVLIAAYDLEHVEPLGNVTPQEAVTFMADQKGMTQGDLADLLGGRSRLSDFMNGVRELSKRQIVALRDALGIPADLLITTPIARTPERFRLPSTRSHGKS